MSAALKEMAEKSTTDGQTRARSRCDRLPALSLGRFNRGVCSEINRRASPQYFLPTPLHPIASFASKADRLSTLLLAARDPLQRHG